MASLTGFRPKELFEVTIAPISGEDLRYKIVVRLNNVIAIEQVCKVHDVYGEYEMLLFGRAFVQATSLFGVKLPTMIKDPKSGAKEANEPASLYVEVAFCSCVLKEFTHEGRQYINVVWSVEIGERKQGLAKRAVFGFLCTAEAAVQFGTQLLEEQLAAGHNP